MLSSLRAAIGCLTIVPVGCPLAVEGRELGRSLVWFPVVGLGLGGILVGMYQLVGLRFPPLVAAVAVVAVLAWLTGAMHLDGVADCCDALAGARTPEARWALMKDPHVGAAAVAGVTCLLLAKVAVIASLPPPAAWRALLLMPVLGRAVMVALIGTLPYARTDEGLATPFVAHRTVTAVGGALGITAAVAWGVLGPPALGLLGGIALLVAVSRLVARRSFGGVTGDVLGAAGEAAEVATVALLGWLA